MLEELVADYISRYIHNLGGRRGVFESKGWDGRGWVIGLGVGFIGLPFRLPQMPC